MPALLTSTSRRSYSERMRSARSRTAASEERSATYEPTFWLLVWLRSSSSVASRRSGLRPCSSTVVPFAASSCATRLPRPSVAPVTSIVASGASVMVTPFRVGLHNPPNARSILKHGSQDAASVQEIRPAQRSFHAAMSEVPASEPDASPRDRLPHLPTHQDRHASTVQRLPGDVPYPWPPLPEVERSLYDLVAGEDNQLEGLLSNHWCS